MRARTVLRDRLANDVTVASLVDGRIYPVMRPQGTALPAIEYEISANNPSNTATGTTGTYECNLTVDCCATTSDGAWELAEAVMAALTATADDDGNIWHMTGERELPGQIMPGTDRFASYVVSQDYTVWYTG